ncbi:hypothetical protein [Erythrobacter sp. AP23]|uniref:hypothetical protein n=1 Tax=Erythrobacter sp. AP23 TaxID=499656 RepID=UPI00076CBA65|nr:hypothetical protein [Erythrobacter sp. AP23]KWV95519.1 hypothetical protein ASS64_16020 [Erythrobacter sp. AP23]
MITLERFRLLEAAIRARGYGPTIEWTESLAPPEDPEDFAQQTIYVICNSGMANTVATVIYDRCMDALRSGRSVTDVFRHPGKSLAIDTIWRERERHFADYMAAGDKVFALRTLPWIGDITALHLAKNFGADVAKPDVHIERLARAESTSTEKLCARLSAASGYRAATVDTILWRACAIRVLNSAEYEIAGWDEAYSPERPAS